MRQGPVALRERGRLAALVPSVVQQARRRAGWRGPDRPTSRTSRQFVRGVVVARSKRLVAVGQAVLATTLPVDTLAARDGPLTLLRELAGAPELDCAFMPWPRPKVSTPEVYPHGLGLPPPTARRGQAWAWLASLYEGSRFARFQTRPPLVPADAAAWAADLHRAKPEARPQVLAQGIEAALPPDPFWDHPRSNDAGRELVQPALARILAGEATAAEELRRIKAPMQAIIDRP